MPLKYGIPGGYPSPHPQPHMGHHPPKNYQRHQSMDNHYTGMRLPGYDHQSPEFKRQKSDSMVVRGHDSRSQAFRDMEHMEHAAPVREDGVPPHVAIMRDIPRYKMMTSGISSMNPPSHMSNGDSVFRQPAGHRPGERPQLKLELPNPVNMYNRQRSSDFISPSPTLTPSTPLDQLQKLANETQFHPNEDYHKMMEMKRQEEYLQGKASPYSSPEGYPQQGRMAMDCSYIESPGNSGSNSVTRGHGPPNTFPKRLKVIPQHLQKSASVPSNMKPTEHRKSKSTFTHIMFTTFVLFKCA